jgi:hypothetical protein
LLQGIKEAGGLLASIMPKAIDDLLYFIFTAALFALLILTVPRHTEFVRYGQLIAIAASIGLSDFQSP